MRRLYLLSLLFLMASPICAQAPQNGNIQVLQSSGGFLRTFPVGTTVTFCAVGATGFPCTPALFTFTNCPPLVTVNCVDVNGNLNYTTLPPNNYQVTITGLSIANPESYALTVGIANQLAVTPTQCVNQLALGIAINGNAVCTSTPGGPYTFSGNITATAGQNALGNVNTFNGILYVGGGITNWTGADIGAQINSAYAALPTTGGDIYVLNGNYSFTTPIVFGTSNKPARLLSAPGAAVTLTYTATTGVAFTYNASINHLWGGGLENITLVGPGSGTATTGMLLGGTNGAEGVIRRNVKVTGFGTAELYGNNTFLTECQHCVYVGNGAPTLSIPNSLTNSGESFSYIDSTIANAPTTGANCINIAAPVNNLSFVGGSFDNCQFTMSAGQVHIVNTHFENPAQTSTVPFVSQTGGNLSLVNPDFQWDGNVNLPTPSAAVSCSSGTLDVSYGSFFAGAVAIINANIAVSGTCNLHELGTKLSSGFTQQIGNTTSGQVSTFANVWGDNQLLAAGSFQIFSGDLILGQIPPGNGYTVHITNPSAARTISVTDPGSNTHWPFVIASGTSTLGTTAIGSGACATTVTTTATNTVGTDAIEWSYASFPNAATDGRLILNAFVSANNVNFSLCNPTAGSLTPSGLVINWSVLR